MFRRSGRLGWLPLALLLVIVAPTARADDDVEDPPVVPENFDASKCTKKPSARDRDDDTPTSSPPAVPIKWTEFEVAGTFVEARDTVHALMAPIMNSHTALTSESRDAIADRAAQYGYHVVGLGTRETETGTHAVLHLAPMPRLRVIKVEMDSGIFSSLRADDVRRRLAIRVGANLPWTPLDRACRLFDESQLITELLREEGYYEARVSLTPKLLVDAGISLQIDIDLGPEYTLDVDRSVVIEGDKLAATGTEIRDVFRHRGTCLLGDYGCIGTPRFRRSQFQTDLQRVTDLFQSRGYPEARVRLEGGVVQVEPRTKTVWFKLTVDQRRRLDVVFEGYDPASVELDNLRKQLTFDDSSSSGDLEADDSAEALTTYLQSRGFFEAKVSWSRERFDLFDRVVYRIEQGRSRLVKRVEIVRTRDGIVDPRAASLSDDEVRTVLGAQVSRAGLFGSTAATTSQVLADDVDRVVDLYRRKGYRAARVKVSAAPDPEGLDSAALSAGLAAADRGDGLYVRYTIEEGPATRISYVSVAINKESDEVKTLEEQALCREVLGNLADLYKHKELARPSTPNRCTAVATDLLFAEEEASLTRDQLRDRMFTAGRPRATVAYTPEVIAPNAVVAKYTLENLQELKFGKVVLRGNFRTRDSTVFDQLNIHEGDSLTQDRLAEAARKLRNLGLFETVNIAMPDLDTTSQGAVNAIVEITERYEAPLVFSAEAGASSFNGLFVRAVPSMQNIDGRGISLDLAGTIGVNASQAILDGQFELRQLAIESTLRIPRYLVPFDLQTEVNAFHRRQDTPRFGLLRTTGATLTFSRTWDRPRVGKRPANARTFSFGYEFRSRSRNLDTIRPIGADADESQAPVSTRTGDIFVAGAWEQRVDSQGILQPLQPAGGFRLDARASWANRYFLGQNHFVKVSLVASKFYSPAPRVLLRADLRYDHGLPIGESLLPEVERFFGGGDATVRGYEDDQLKTEVIEVPVPPLDNVTQIRVLPAGGNIRLLGSLDGQVRIAGPLASAVFVDAGVITNDWGSVTTRDIRPAVGVALARLVFPFGTVNIERAIPLRPQLGDDPRGRWHVSFAARAQF